MPYYKHQGRIYQVHEVPYVPNGAWAESVPEPQAPPTPSHAQHIQAQLQLAEERIRRINAEANLNYLRDKQRAADVEAQRRATAPPVPKPQSKPAVYVDRVIDPSVR